MTREATPADFSPARFIKGIIGSDELTEDAHRKHIAFVGRSNVGKSSLMNALLGRNNLVKSSARPGKTTEINYFEVGEHYYFVDLPGYGFARLGAKQREKLRKLIVWYLLRSEIAKRAVCMVLDAGVGMTDFDREVLALIEEAEIPVCIVVNKIDRLNQSERAKCRQEMETMGLSYFMLSARTGRGLGSLQEWLVSI
ncbi:MAG: ribosome biogenesis GTP-binding protein YihA/YsxC [Patescibacteria group bacterium]